MTVHAPARVYRLHISLLEVEPRIWRRVQVPAAISLRQLHDVFQITMGWTNSHLHEFVVGNEHFGCTDPRVDPPEDLRDDCAFMLDTVAPKAGREFVYNYDFGDDWDHRVVIESIEDAGVAGHRALCLDGARACPPEDCGGPHAYQSLLTALRDPSHERHREFVEWIGEEFDPDRFELDAVNRKLSRLRLLLRDGARAKATRQRHS